MSRTVSRVKNEDAMSTHDSSLPSESMDLCCYWCSRINFREETYNSPRDETKRLRKLFHTDCECRHRDDSLPSSTCGFCKHLNIRHLVRCVLIRDNLRLPKMFSDWYCRENPQDGCQLCEYIASYGTSGSEIRLHIYKNWVNPWCILNLMGTHNDWVDICLSQNSDPQLQEHVNWKRIRGWMPKTYVEEGDLPVDFRVIDVGRNCIVTPKYPVDYVALSYVWGNSSRKEKPFQASRHNIKDLEIEGSLSGASLPRTIIDAVEVCRQLDRKYLWVDRLCIIQDDESKHGQIRRMDSIFGSSAFTIVALSGQDANDGLLGVSGPRQLRRLATFKWQEIVFTNFFPKVQDLVKSSYWAKRGWTFQEEFCSKNNLYFTEYGVYHSCRNSEFPNTECPAIVKREPTQRFEFPISVEAYAARSFTDPGDLLRAFTGVLNMVFGHGHHSFGSSAPKCPFPTAYFYQWIHWQPVDWEYEARRPPKDISMELVSHIQPHESDIFPSWSWTSAQGGVRFTARDDPVALWAFPVAQGSQGDGNVRWVSTNYEADRLRVLTVEGGLMRAREFPFQPTDGSVLQCELIAASPTLLEKAARDEACKKLGRILSFTQVSSLRLESLDGHFPHGRRTFQIISSTGECVGGIWLPKLSFEYAFNKDGSLEEKDFDFMAVSRCDVHQHAEDVLNSVGLKDSNDREVLNVMLIGHAKHSIVARRLGIGHVFKDQWFKERPVLKTVVIE